MDVLQFLRSYLLYVRFICFRPTYGLKEYENYRIVKLPVFSIINVDSYSVMQFESLKFSAFSTLHLIIERIIK